MFKTRIRPNSPKTARNLAIGKALTGAIVAVGLACVVIGSASAQTAPPTPGAQSGTPRARGGGRRNVSLYSIPISALDYVVKLTAEEKTKITAIRETAAADIKAETDRTKRRPIETKASDDIKAVLTTDQASTFDQYLPGLTLVEQSQAIPLKVLADIKLTEDQISKLHPLVTDTTDKIKALSTEDRRTKRPEILADFKTKVDAILTPDQLAIIAKATPPADPPTTAPATKPAV
jgi:hypothetical protein